MKGESEMEPFNDFQRRTNERISELELISKEAIDCYKNAFETRKSIIKGKGVKIKSRKRQAQEAIDELKIHLNELEAKVKKLAYDDSNHFTQKNTQKLYDTYPGRAVAPKSLMVYLAERYYLQLSLLRPALKYLKSPSSLSLFLGIHQPKSKDMSETREVLRGEILDHHSYYSRIAKNAAKLAKEKRFDIIYELVDFVREKFPAAYINVQTREQGSLFEQTSSVTPQG